MVSEEIGGEVAGVAGLPEVVANGLVVEPLVAAESVVAAVVTGERAGEAVRRGVTKWVVASAPVGAGESYAATSW